MALRIPRSSVAYADSYQLVEPDRDLLLHRTTQGGQADDFEDITELENRLLDFEDHHNAVTESFDWTFDKDDQAKGTAERDEAIELIKGVKKKRRASLGADKGL